ncbi:MAG TPA: glucokinase [Microcoleaceae cyanobacterium]|jgi:glucokinase
MTILLAGDIGGTKTSLRLVESQPARTAKQPPVQTTLYENTYPSQNYPDLVPIVQQLLMEAEQKLAEGFEIDAACFGIAGPVIHDTCELTNLSWSLNARTLEKQLNIPCVRLINDFAAIGYGVVGLAASDIHTLQVGEPDPEAPIAVLGAGTGLGEAFLIPEPTGYRVFPSEGSHADLPMQTELGLQLTRYLREKHGIDRVSIERVVSGMGIVSIYQFLRSRGTAPESPEMAELFNIWEQQIGYKDKTVDPAAMISKAAIAGTDPLCEETMTIFIRAYGAEAGNLALKLLPFGGLYVAGGIVTKNLPLMIKGDFMDSFLQKGRMTPLMQRIPVHLVLNSKVGLIGAALHAASLACMKK